jgi:hypothetical protein
MESTIQTMAEQAKEKFKARYHSTEERLERFTKAATTETWYEDVLDSLWVELILSYTLLEQTYTQKTLSIGFSRTAELAWRSRNILEVTVWALYCLSDKSRAYQFYGDRRRDLADWVSAFQQLAAFAAEFESLPEELDRSQFQRCKEELEALVHHIKSGSQEVGLSNAAMNKSYKRLNNAAEDLGDEGKTFNRINTILSKFAHPTAFTIFTFPDQGIADQFADIFYVLGLTFAVTTLEIFDKHLAVNDQN